MTVSESVQTHVSATTLHHFWCVLPVSVARSSSGGGEIRVFPVLWMTSCFLQWTLWRLDAAAAASSTAASLTLTHVVGIYCVVLVVSSPRRPGAPRLDKSFMQGLPGRSMPFTVSLLVTPAVAELWVQ